MVAGAEATGTEVSEWYNK